MNIKSLSTQEVLERISRHCPEALSAYLQCFNRADKEGFIFFSKEIVQIEMSEEWNPFCKNIKKLARENLLSWLPFNKGIQVNMAELNEDE